MYCGVLLKYDIDSVGPLSCCKYSKPCMWCFHYLPLGSLHTLGASESPSCSQVSFNLIQNGLRVRYIIKTYMDEIYKHAFYACAIWDTQANKNWWIITVLTHNPTVLIFVDINDAPKCWQKHVATWVVVAVSGQSVTTREKISGFYLIGLWDAPATLYGQSAVSWISDLDNL